MPRIYEYLEYRDFIRDTIAEKKIKIPGYSIRAAAQKIGINSGTLTRILNGTRQLGPSLLPKLLDFLKLRTVEAHYFSELVRFSRLTDPATKRECYQELLKIRDEKKNVIEEKKHRFFEHWYHIAIHQLFRIIDNCQDPAILGTLLNPAISEFKVKKALALLTQLGLIETNAKGGYSTIDPTLTTGDHWQGVAIHAFQVQMAQQAVQALDTFSKAVRDFSTLTINVSPESFETTKKILQNARNQIQALELNGTDSKHVYQLNMQLFPLSNTHIERRD